MESLEEVPTSGKHYEGIVPNIIGTIYFNTPDNELKRLAKEVERRTFGCASAMFAEQELFNQRALLDPALAGQFIPISRKIGGSIVFACETGKIVQLGKKMGGRVHEVRGFRREPGEFGWEIDDYGRVGGVVDMEGKRIWGEGKWIGGRGPRPVE